MGNKRSFLSVFCPATAWKEKRSEKRSIPVLLSGHSASSVLSGQLRTLWINTSSRSYRKNSVETTAPLSHENSPRVCLALPVYKHLKSKSRSSHISHDLGCGTWRGVERGKLRTGLQGWVAQRYKAVQGAWSAAGI